MQTRKDVRKQEREKQEGSWRKEDYQGKWLNIRPGRKERESEIKHFREGGVSREEYIIRCGRFERLQNPPKYVRTQRSVGKKKTLRIGLSTAI